MKRSFYLMLSLIILADLPIALGAPSVAVGSYAQYSRTTSSPSGDIVNGTFRWDVQGVSGQLAKIAVSNNQTSQTNFTLYIDLSTRIEIPSYLVAFQNPTATQPSVGTDHLTKTFFWIDPNPAIGSVIDTDLGAAIVNGTESITLPSGAVKKCWILVSQSLGASGFAAESNATLLLWYDQRTGLLVKLDQEAASSGASPASDKFLLTNTNINSFLSLPLTLTAVEWASLTMSIIALILGGIAVAVAVDLRHFRRGKML